MDGIAKTLVVTNEYNEVLCLLYMNEQNQFTIVEPANGVVAVHIFNDNEPVFESLPNGCMRLSHNKFITKVDY